MKKFLVLLAMLVTGPAAAQWQTPQYSIPVGRGPGVTGFNSALPGPAGSALISNGTSANPTFQLLPFVTTASCGIVADGSDETTKLQNCVNQIMSSGGALSIGPYASCIKTTSPIIIDRSSVVVRYQHQLMIEGSGEGPSCISNTTGSGALLSYLGNASALESGLVLRNVRLTGNLVTGSTGLQIQKSAFALLDNVAIEGMDYGIDATDTDQFESHSTQIRFNNHGVRFNAASSVTAANSLNFFNTTIGNNAVWGGQFTNCNALTYIGGSIQYNGVIGGGTGQWGIKTIDCGTGYGTQLYSGMIFEGNGGAGDYLSSQSAGAFKTNVTFNTVSFTRTANFGTVGYGTNQVAISGAGTNATYKFINSSFWGYSPYAASAGRPAIANTNTNALIEIDGFTNFWSATEAPITSALYTGQIGSRTGSIVFAGITSGAITISPQSAAGTYNFNLPTTAGTAGLCMASGGGGASPMTWTACSGGSGSPGGSSTQVQYNNAGTFGGITGATTNGVALTLVAPVLGTPASATLTNATGLPISTGLTGTGTGVLTALAVNTGTAGAPVINGGALGTPTSGVATNLTGTAAGLTAGTVTTNANLTGPITSSGNATSVAAQVGTGSTFVMSVNPTFPNTITVSGNAAFPGAVIGGILPASNLVLASTTSGAPSGDQVNITGSTINLNGAAVGSSTLSVATSITSPKHIGGTGTTGTQLTFQTTSGVGTTDQFAWTGGNNGATNFANLSSAAFTLPSTLVVNNPTSSSSANITSATKNWSSVNAANIMAIYTTFGDASRFIFKRGEGTIAAPTGVATNTLIGAVQFRAYTTSGDTLFNSAAIRGVTSETQTATAQGGKIQFNTSNIGTTNDSTKATLFDDGGFTIGTGTTSPGVGSFSLDGQAFMPNALSDAGLTDSTACIRTSNGQILKGSGTLGICLGTSSARYKHDIILMGAGLAEIVKLSPKNFYYNAGFGDGGAKQQFGFIAEDVVKVLPKLTGLDDKGRPNSVDMLGMIPILVKAVQELKADNDNLHAQLSSMRKVK